jgi:hypothetical protein
MGKGPLYTIIAILLAAVVGGGFYLYREETKPGIELKADEDGVSIQKN